MSGWLKLATITAIIGAFSLLLVILNDISSTYTKLGTVTTQLNQVNKELTEIKQDFKNYKIDVQKVNEIDTKFTKELADAKANNDRLYNNVLTGIGKLQFNINKTTSVSTTNAECTRLSDTAQRNYFILRERIEQSRLQIEGLQQYINGVCLSK